MASNVPAVARRLLTALAAVVGAQAAWSAGYYASFALCCLLLLWAGGWLLAGRRLVGEGESVSDRRWADALLQREREARSLAAFLDHAPVPLLALRSRGTLSALNLSARRFFATDDVVTDPPAPLLNTVLGAAPGERRTLTLETDGLQRAYALTISELVSDGDVVRMAALVDIQAEIQAAEAAALRELMQVLSHEIMNSLTPVTSLAHTAAELLRAPDAALALPETLEAVESVARRSEGLLTFVGAYRELARLPEPRLADVSVSRLLDEAALLFRSRWSSSGVSLELVKPPSQVTRPMDANLMTQALLNVLTNAAEAALEGAGRPAVRLEALARHSGRLRIAVSDNGPGVRLADPSVIFRPFFTTKPGGTGVGLSLARQVVLAHGGEINVDTSTSAETTILISL